MGSLDAYEVLNVIGKGSFGVVSKIRRKADGKTLVWKEMDYGKMNEKEKQLLVSEVNILRELRHPNIVRYYDRIIVREQTKIYIVMEYCEGGDLALMVKKCKKSRKLIDSETVWRVFSQVVLAVNECHARKDGRILHRDLKPGNILLDSGMNVKLGDFGLARVMGSNSLYAKTYVGTPFYMSPEQINDRPYDERSDIWSLGCLIYEMCSLYPPFDATNQLTLAVKIKAGRFSRIPSQYPDDLHDLIARCLSLEPHRRPTIADLMKHRQISLRLRETKLQQQIQLTQKQEDELAKRIQVVEARERKVEAKERELGITTAEGVRPRSSSMSFSSSSKMEVKSEENNTITEPARMVLRSRSRAPSVGGGMTTRPPRGLEKENVSNAVVKPRPGLRTRFESAPNLKKYFAGGALGLNDRLTSQ